MTKISTSRRSWTAIVVVKSTFITWQTVVVVVVVVWAFTSWIRLLYSIFWILLIFFFHFSQNGYQLNNLDIKRSSWSTNRNLATQFLGRCWFRIFPSRPNELKNETFQNFEFFQDKRGNRLGMYKTEELDLYLIRFCCWVINKQLASVYYEDGGLCVHGQLLDCKSKRTLTRFVRSDQLLNVAPNAHSAHQLNTHTQIKQKK